MARTVNNAITATSTSCLVKPCRFGRSITTQTPPTRVFNPITGAPYLEAAGQYFKAGDHVYLNAGAVTEVLYNGTGPIAGFALTDAATVTGTQIEIMPVIAGPEYIMHVTNGTTETTCIPATVALSYVGNAYELSVATITYAAGHPKFPFGGGAVTCSVIDIARSAVPRVVITGLVNDPEVIATSTLIPVYVKFLSVIPAATSYQGLQF